MQKKVERVEGKKEKREGVKKLPPLTCQHLQRHLTGRIDEPDALQVKDESKETLLHLTTLQKSQVKGWDQDRC